MSTGKIRPEIYVTKKDDEAFLKALIIRISTAKNEYEAHKEDDLWKNCHVLSCPEKMFWLNSNNKNAPQSNAEILLDAFIISVCMKWDELRAQLTKDLTDFGYSKADMKNIFDRRWSRSLPTIQRLINEAAVPVKESMEEPLVEGTYRRTKYTPFVNPKPASEQQNKSGLYEPTGADFEELDTYKKAELWLWRNFDNVDIANPDEKLKKCINDIVGLSRNSVKNAVEIAHYYGYNVKTRLYSDGNKDEPEEPTRWKEYKFDKNGKPYLVGTDPLTAAENEQNRRKSIGQAIGMFDETYGDALINEYLDN